jgi:hypothetical protein
VTDEITYRVESPAATPPSLDSADIPAFNPRRRRARNLTPSTSLCAVSTTTRRYVRANAFDGRNWEQNVEKIR